MKRAVVAIVMLISVCCVSLSQGIKPSKAQIVKDIVGQEFSDPSPDSYFSESDIWTIRQQDIRAITVIQDTVSKGRYTAQAIVHLQKKGFLADAFSIIQYTNNSGKWSFDKLRVRSLTFPHQRDYVRCIELYEDMSFIPTLMARNNGLDTLLVGFDFTDTKKAKRLSRIIAPRQSKPVCIIIPQNYRASFAYVCDADSYMINTIPEEPAHRGNDYNTLVFDGIFFPSERISGGFTLSVWKTGDDADPYRASFACGNECIQLSGHISSEADGTKSLNLYSHETVLAIHIPLNEGDNLARYPFIKCEVSRGHEYESAVIYRQELLEILE